MIRDDSHAGFATKTMKYVVEKSFGSRYTPALPVFDRDRPGREIIGFAWQGMACDHLVYSY